jgi:hypothetical protein
MKTSSLSNKPNPASHDMAEVGWLWVLLAMYVIMTAWLLVNIF